MKVQVMKLVSAATLLLILATGAQGALKSIPAPYDQSLRKGETRATLNPDMFRAPDIRKAYQVAKEIPGVLDSIYCNCQCEESPAFRHKSLLSCYVDNHASTWDICVGEALRAFELYKKGYPVKKIRDIVEREYRL